MFPDNTGYNITLAIIFVLGILGNVTFILYQVINKPKTSVDKFFLCLSVVQLLVVVIGIPFVNSIWFGEAYQHGAVGCQGFVPLHSVCDICEALLLCVLVASVAEKLKGDEHVLRHMVWSLVLVFLSAVVMTMPYFGVNVLTKRNIGGKMRNVCVEDWNEVASRIFRLVRVAFQFVVPLVVFIYFNVKSWKIISFMHEYIGTKKVRAKYQSFSKVVAETNDNSEPNYLKFTESEEMNLEMNQIYQRENSISSIQQEEGSSNVSVQIFTNEITIEKITSNAPLWKGKIPETKWKQENEFQKLAFSIKWFKYTRNLFYISFAASILFITSVFPSEVMTVFSLAVPPLAYNDAERSAAKAVFCLRFLPAIVNPWLFLFGIVKYRRSIFKCKKRCC